MLFIAIDDDARIAFTAMHADERTPSAVQFLRDAVAYYARLGVTVRRLLTDNGSAFRSRDFAAACKALGVRHRFTRPTSLRPTARLNDSSSQHCASGPTASPINISANERRRSTAGTITRTGTARIKASAAPSRCPDSARPETTS